MSDKSYFLRHYKSKNAGYGKDLEAHTYWLMSGDKDPGSIDEYDFERGGTFRYCHVADFKEDIYTDLSCYKKVVKDARLPLFLKEHNVTKNFLLNVCGFLNSGDTPKKKKGHYYISEFANRSICHNDKVTYTLNLVKSDDKRANETRDDSGGFINKETGDVNLFDFVCFGYKMRNHRKKLMQNICNALNQGIIEHK